MSSYYITGTIDGQLHYLRHQMSEGPRWTTIRAQREKFAGWTEAFDQLKDLLYIPEYFTNWNIEQILIRKDK